MTKTIRTTSLIVGALSLLVLARYAGYLRFIEQGTRAITDSVIRSGYDLATPNAPAVSDRSSDSCLSEDTQLRLLEEENKNLRDQLNFLKILPHHIGAAVIGRDLDPIGTTIIIDQGSRAGLVVNAPVITGNGLLIGKIARVNDTTAVVRLLSDFQSSVAATVVNRDKSLGVIEGGFGLAVRLNLIPQNEVIKPGDTIVTSGLEAGIPRGLMIGTVEVVEKKPQEPFQQAIIRPTADLEAITAVSVIIP